MSHMRGNSKDRPHQKLTVLAPWTPTSRPPEPGDNAFILFKPPSLCYFVMAAPINYTECMLSENKRNFKTEPYRSPINIKRLEQEEKAIHEAETGKSEN